MRPRIVWPLPIPPASSLPAPHASPRAQIHCSCAYSVLGPTPLQPQGLCTNCVLLSHVSPTWLPQGTLLRFLHTFLQSRFHGSFMQFISDMYSSVLLVTPPPRNRNSIIQFLPLSQLFSPFCLFCICCNHPLSTVCVSLHISITLPGDCDRKAERQRPEIKEEMRHI